MPAPEFITPRLRLRALCLDDVPAIVEMDADPEVRHFIGGPREPVAHAAFIRERIAADAPRVWAVERRAVPGLIGILALSTVPDTTLTEIAWRLARTAWGTGFATEAAVAILRHAVQDLGIDPVIALIHPDNEGSARVATKIGLVLAGEMFAYGKLQRVFSTRGAHTP